VQVEHGPVLVQAADGTRVIVELLVPDAALVAVCRSGGELRTQLVGAAMRQVEQLTKLTLLPTTITIKVTTSRPAVCIPYDTASR
jgi:hypothetical protein